MQLKTIRYILWGLVGVAVLGVGGAYYLNKTGSGMNLVPMVAKLGTPFNLVDYNGEPITEKAFEGHPTALFFGFTNCPEVCPTTVYEISNWLTTLGEEGEPLRVFFISIDPERDTPEMLSDYLKAQSERVVGITGPQEEIDKLVLGWRVFTRKVPLDDGDYTMDHTASIYLVRPDGSFQGTIAYGEDTDVAIEKLRLLLKS
ncbi:MAG: SCO family protein [Hyphomicrobiales bacterium]|nr:MAG: SCO family protein [Hyphomicrobiales bacterium]